MIFFDIMQTEGQIVLMEGYMKTYDIGNKRQVLWDTELADSSFGINLKMHSLTRKGSVLECDAPWEGEHSGYGKIIFDGEKYRFYYRGCGGNDGVWKTENGDHYVWCVAYSYDGKTFEKPNLGICEYNGSKDNNIIEMHDDYHLDNFSIMLDESPNCTPDAKYKALKGSKLNGERCLIYYKSADGLHFEQVKVLDVKGFFDSMNIAFYDKTIGKYRLYMRDFHPLDENNRIEYEKENHVRDVRLCLSDDFINWTEPAPLVYSDPLEIQLYTNNIMKYFNSDVYLGMPARYIDRAPDEINYKYLPDVGGFRPMLLQLNGGRGGSAMTETMLMVSRDGYHFNRFREAFFTSGIENGENWVYGDGYFAYGMIETESDFYGEPKELSLYVGHGYRARPLSFERYTIRIDGFYSWRADFEEGKAVTKPLTFSGNTLSVNFATSALGYLRIRILDEDGAPIEGYDSGRLFGNSIDRPCDFEKSLSELCGKTVRLEFSMKDCDFYSFIFK